MAYYVCNGAQLSCTFSFPPGGMSNLVVDPSKNITIANQPAANIMDHIPFVNIMPFPQCISTANPAVASATSAASGVLTPSACTPMTEQPWTPGKPTVLIKGSPALIDSCKLACQYQGQISIINPGQEICSD